MKKTILAITAMLLTACNQGYNYLEQPYDDNSFKDFRSQTQAQQLIQDARIAALENEVAALQAGVATAESDYLAQSLVLQAIAVQVAAAPVQILPICSSGENLIKTVNGIYAVYMVSNNYGTYLGKLENNVAYQTTDVTHTAFHLTNGAVVCQ